MVYNERIFKLELLIDQYQRQRYQNERLNKKCIQLTKLLIEAEKERAEEFEERMFSN